MTRGRTPPPSVQPTEATGEAVGRIQDVTYLGGRGTALQQGARYDLTFFERALVFAGHEGPAVTISYGDLAEMEAGGPGAFQEGPQFFGGGFGPQAAEGMLIAGLANKLFGQTRIETVLRISGPQIEVFVLTDAATPEQLTVVLSPIRALLPQQSERVVEGRLVDEIERLAGLHDRGLLTDSEFQAAKQKLLGTSADPSAGP